MKKKFYGALMMCWEVYSLLGVWYLALITMMTLTV